MRECAPPSAAALRAVLEFEFAARIIAAEHSMSVRADASAQPLSGLDGFADHGRVGLALTSGTPDNRTSTARAGRHRDVAYETA
jgi:hypothetical protein